ncbi:MAG: energy-coupling factor ABC transporter ATP-binding protein [Ardenticatenaceae bacterium]|nr:energy-coupling factor ABC transporter ATP-binding protein [Ardenticatenaceae bacterium]
MAHHLLARTPIISIENVTFTYLGERAPALQDINLEVMAGEFVLILGPSGSGKSSLVNLLNGTIPSIFEGGLTGDVIVDGRNTRDHPTSELATILGQVLQDPEAQIVNLFVRDEIYFGPENLNMPAEVIRRNAEEVMSFVNITHLQDREVFHLSGGQKQKVALASVLAVKPKILVLDQPTANLDPHSTREVFRLLGRLNTELGITVLVVEHNVDDLIDLVSTVVVMNEGRIAIAGSPREVFGPEFSGSSTQLGLWMPQIAELGLHLNGVVDGLSRVPLTVDEAFGPLVAALARVPEERQALSDPDHPFLRHESVASEQPSRPLIEINNLSFTYPGGEARALSNVNLRIDQGDFVAVIGKNGSGKSTLAKILTKINEPPPGTVSIRGRDITKMSLFDVTNSIGYVFQNPDHQFVTDTVFDEVAYSLRVRGVPEQEVTVRVIQVLEHFGLQTYTGLSPFALSMGHRRLLSVATMLVVDQDAIILDEPTIGQDQVSSDLLMGFLTELNGQGKTVIVITHDMRLISKWVGRAVIMSDSRVLFDGPIYDVFQREDLLREAALVEPPLVTLIKRLKPTYPSLSTKVLTTDVFSRIFTDVEGSLLGADERTA